MAVRKIDRLEVAYHQGRMAYRREDPDPENVWSDEEWNGPLCDSQARWLGYKVEHGLTLLREDRRREAVRDYIERGIDLPPEMR